MAEQPIDECALDTNEIRSRYDWVYRAAKNGGDLSNFETYAQDVARLLIELARYKTAVSAVIDKPLTPHPKYRQRGGAAGSKEVDLFYGKNLGFNEAANILRVRLGRPIQTVPTPDE